MLKVMAFLVKKQGLDTGDLIDYYETHHVPLIISLAPAPTTYRRNYLRREATTSGPDDFDVPRGSEALRVVPAKINYSKCLSLLSL